MSLMISMPLRKAPRLLKPAADSWLTLGVTGFLILFMYSGPILRAADPAAAAADPGILSLIVLAVLALLAFIALSLWLLGLLWPVFRDYRNLHFKINFKTLLPWQKIMVYLLSFFLLLYAFVACLSAVL